MNSHSTCLCRVKKPGGSWLETDGLSDEDRLRKGILDLSKVRMVPVISLKAMSGPHSMLVPGAVVGKSLEQWQGASLEAQAGA